MPRGPRFGFERIRELVRTRVEETSLREVALDIGMSFSGLHSFLRGGEPYQRTREKLTAWYARSRHQTVAPPTPEEVDAAITVLTQYLHRSGSLRVAEREFKAVVDRLRPPSELNEDSAKAKP
jgi:hypothetical protein